MILKSGAKEPVSNQKGQNNFNDSHVADFDKAPLVYNKLRELKNSLRRPITLKQIFSELENRISRAEITQALRSLQESGEITSIPGAEMSYDLY